MGQVDQLRSAPLGEDYLSALEDLSKIRKSIAQNQDDPNPIPTDL